MKRRFPGIGQEALCVLLLFVFAHLPLYPIVLSNAVPLDLAPLYGQAPWMENAPPGTSASSRPAAHNDAFEFYPAYAFLHRAHQQDDSLFWNPYVRAGEPFFANQRTRALSPFTLPFYFFDLTRALQLSALLKLLAAGGCAYYVARTLGIAPPLALLAAASFQLSPVMVLRIADPITDVAPWFPLLFLYTERTALGHLRYWPTGALAAALMLLGGDWAAAAIGFGACFAYLLVRSAAFRAARRPTTVALTWLGAIALGGALAAVQLIPAAAFIADSVPAPGLDGSHAPAWRLPDAAGILFPRSASDYSGNEAAILYLGILPLLLALLWCAVRHHSAGLYRRRYDLLLLLSVTAWVAVACALAFPVWAAIAPTLEQTLVFAAFASGLTAAAAAQDWLELNPQQCISSLRRLAVLLLLAIAAAIALWAATMNFQSRWTSALVWDSAVAAAAFVAALAVLAVTLLRPSNALLGFGATLIAAASALSATAPAIHFTHRFAERSHSPLISAIGERAILVAHPQSGAGWPLSEYGIRTVTGHGGRTLPGYAALLHDASSNPRIFGYLSEGWFVLGQEDLRGPFADLRPELHLEQAFECGVGLFRIAQPPARAVILYNVAQPGQSEELDHAFDAPVHLNADSLPALGPEDPNAEISILSESNARLEIQTKTVSPGLLVVRAPWAPGWTANVNNSSAEVFPVNGFYRSVAVPAGTCRVEFRYTPPGFSLGITVSLAAAGLILLGYGWLAGLQIRRSRRLAAMRAATQPIPGPSNPASS